MSRLTLLAPTFFCLLFLLSPTTIATPAPVPAPVNGDPCGPTIQDTPNYPNTCSVAPALVESPQPYGINCTNVGPTSKYTATVAWENCTASYQSICTKAVDARTRKGVWIWSSLAQGCALGVFLPPYQGSAQLLNFTRCEEIFTAMNDTCSTVVPASNYGGVNLKNLPGYPPTPVKGQPGSNFKGDAVNVGYPSYAITWIPPTNPLS